jgi:hypothetical protein
MFLYPKKIWGPLWIYNFSVITNVKYELAVCIYELAKLILQVSSFFSILIIRSPVPTYFMKIKNHLMGGKVILRYANRMAEFYFSIRIVWVNFICQSIPQDAQTFVERLLYLWKCLCMKLTFDYILSKAYCHL